MSQVVVVGSANLDLVLAVERIPRPGETVLAGGFSRGPGGKGANQAAAAARAGASTAFVTSLGDDEAGGILRDALTAAGVDLGLVTSTASTTGTPTGTAVITVDAAGENAISVAPAANAELVLDDLATDAIAAAEVVLLQLEIPFGVVRAAAAAGRYVVLNAAPAAPLDDDLLGQVDLLVVNEHEAAVITGRDAPPPVTGPLLLASVPTVVVTLGGDGVLVLTRDAEPLRLPGIAVEVADTTAAGDTFCGVLAASLARGAALPDAVRRANAAASLCVQTAGAIASVPTAAAIDARFAEVYGGASPAVSRVPQSPDSAGGAAP